MTSLASLPTDAAATLPSCVRYRVVSLAVLLGMVTYLDRVCISTLAPYIEKDLALSEMQMGYVFSAFALSYALFGLPAAAWADRVGTRKALTGIVIWWSVFTMTTASGINQTSLMVIRFFFGAGEAGAWPAVARTFSRWIPYRERGTVQGIFFVGAHVVGGMTPLLVMWMAGFLPWRMIFVLFGLLGFVWAAVWCYWFRDDPAEHRQVNAAELALIAADRKPDPAVGAGGKQWWRLLGDRNVLALCLMYVPNSFGFYFCITWLPRYLQKRHGLEDASLGIFAGLPLVLSVLADVSGGVTTDWAVRRFGPRLGRAGVGFTAYFLAGMALILAVLSTHPWIAATWIAVGTACSMFMLGAAWSTCQDIGGTHTAMVGAMMNTAGQIGAIACPVVVKCLVEQYNDWNAALVLIGVIFLLGALCWLVVDPRKRVFQ
jgi:MFS family permease